MSFKQLATLIFPIIYPVSNTFFLYVKFSRETRDTELPFLFAFQKVASSAVGYLLDVASEKGV